MKQETKPKEYELKKKLKDSAILNIIFHKLSRTNQIFKDTASLLIYTD